MNQGTKDGSIIMFREVRCCCNPDNLIGYLPADVTDYEVLELEGGGSAFNSQDEEEVIRARSDFREEVTDVLDPSVGKKTWKKTWRKVNETLHA